ncbi:MAG: Flp pilus assembly complex ATPase component TadA [Deltaproteobacteria bacterium]|nr:Flp pilus assembly complex ATPase component TadA [Deltaproteobacteria bacterium]
MIELMIREKSGEEKRMSFDKDMLMLGRAQGNDVILETGGISRFHATIALEGDTLVITDVGSTNGTFVNAQKTEGKVPVKPTDAVVIGDYVISVAYRREDESESDKPLEPIKTEAIEPAAPVEEKKPAPRVQQQSQSEFYWKSMESFLAPIWSFLLDDTVSEVLINGKDEIYIERKGRMMPVDAKFTTDQLSAAVLNIAQYVGRRVSEDEPYMDARLPDGSRVAVLLPPCSRKGISVSIRKFAKEKLTMDKLVDFGSLSPDMVTFLNAAVVLKKNIIVSGGTSSGKTSLLNVVSGLIPDDERILTIEDAAELQLRQDHVVPMETKPPDKKGRGQVTIRDLVRASLRMRPDRIVVGEIRSGEALDLLQAMNTGHSGSMATVHASSPLQALTRLETLALFSGIEIPMRALREQVSTAIEIIIQAARLPDHSRKVTHISEVGAMKEDGSYEVHDIYRFVRSGMHEGKIIGGHEWTGHKPKSIEEMELAGLTEALRLFEK